jgi:hypothetical protein
MSWSAGRLVTQVFSGRGGRGAAPGWLGVAMLGRRPGFLRNWKIASSDLGKTAIARYNAEHSPQ